MRKKKLFFLFAMLLGLSASAQQIGEWQVYPSFGVATQNVAVGHRVYGVASGHLLCYDADDTSVRTYDSMNDLNDIHIQYIDYSAAAKRLILIYDNGNIDLLDLDDNVQNLSSLKESTLNNRTVNCLSIDGTMAYVGTGFGFFTVDMQEGVIRDTYRLGVEVEALTAKDGTILIATDEGIYRSGTADLHLLTNWEKASTWSRYFNRILVFNNEVYVLRGTSLYRLEGTRMVSLLDGVTYLTTSGDQLIYMTASKVYVQTASGQQVVEQETATWQSVSYGGNTYWVSEGLDGLKGYRLSGDTFAESVGSIRPNSPVRDLFYRMQYVDDRLLVAGGINTPYAIYNPATAMYYEDGVWTNFDEQTPAEQYPALHCWNTTNVVQDPNDPSHHYASNYRTGLYEYRDGKFVGLYNSDNSPLQQINNYGLNYVGCASLQYDDEGNLWMANQETDTIVRILQPSGRWLSLYYDEIKGTSILDDYLFTTSGVKFLVSRRVEGRGFFGFHTNGTLNTVRDDKHQLRSTIINQDGTSYSPDRFFCMAEDMDGRVWCGCDAGLFVINDPTEFFDSNFQFEQIKIARNDGSGLADYLLSGVAITCIAVDGANRKWVGTSSNGLYLVSADGQELLQHFESDDSPLLSNNIQCLAIHPATGLVMIGTDQGLCSYVSDATEAEEELRGGDVVAYPNPVRPDYTGPIAIRGLTMDGEVKILSSTGQLVWNGVSNGGTLTWNGHDKHGRRVSCGVYHVVANTQDGKKAVVSRIIVIK